MGHLTYSSAKEQPENEFFHWHSQPQPACPANASSTYLKGPLPLRWPARHTGRNASRTGPMASLAEFQEQFGMMRYCSGAPPELLPVETGNRAWVRWQCTPLRRFFYRALYVGSEYFARVWLRLRRSKTRHC